MDRDLDNTRNTLILRLDGVGFRYSDAMPPVLREVCFQLSEGEIVSVVGRSGIGKSTLLKLLSGELRPTSGAAFRAESVERPGARAFVDQDSTVFSWMRVRQIVRLCLSRDPACEKISVEEALAAFGLEGTGEKYPSQLSGGMRQRLALAFALLRRPQMLLLDEPFVSVDDFTKEALYQLLQNRLTNTRTAVVIITHDINECLTLSDKVVVLAGRVSATVVDTFLVRGPKPRTGLLLLEPEFVRLNREIRTAILSEVR